MKNKSFIAIFLLLLILSCKDSTRKENVKLTPETIKLENKLAFKFNERFKLARMIPLETKSECLITHAKGLALADNIYFQDLAQKLFVFDYDGKFIRQIGSKGQGPEQYLAISDFYIKDSLVVILDNIGECLVKYNKNGTYIGREKTPIGFSYIFDTNANKMIYSNNIGGELNYDDKNKCYYKLLFFGNDNTIISRYLAFPEKSIGSIYDTGSPFYKYSNSVCFIEPINDTIYQINDSVITPKYVVNFGKHKRPSDFMEKTAAPDVYREMTINDYAKSITTFYEFSDIIYFRAIIGDKNNKHVIYDKNSKQSFTAGYIVDMTNNIKVQPISYKGDGRYFLSIIQFSDFVDKEENMQKEDGNPILVFYDYETKN